MSYLLTVQNLSKVYPNGTHALKSINLSVKQGEFLVVIGLSGSGKSTLLRCLNGLIQPTSGEISFEGKPATHLSPEELRRHRQKVAMIFQHFNLIPRHSVKTNVLTGSLGRTSTWRSFFQKFSPEDIAKADEALKLVGITDKAQMRADQLSGGQQQRVAIARALVQGPKLLLADEPVASLDPATSHSVMDHLRFANQKLGITIIANLHFLSLVREYGGRVVALKAGELVFDGSPSEITDSWFKKIYGEGAREVHIN